jgi:hypothetical protein
MPMIHIDGLVSFAPNVAVIVHREAMNVSAERLAEAVRTAYSYMDEPHLLDACCGGMGPLTKYSELTLTDYLRLLQEIKVTEAGAKAKKVHTKVRRAEFSSKRSHLVLTMLDAGVPYICAIPGCGVIEQLTVDHIKALSRGGTDELSNLRFLCRQCNSEKRDMHDA